MKRALDLVVALCGLVLLAPTLLLIAAIIRCSLGSPVLFAQRRPGLNAKPFTLVKFRTMSEQRNSNGELLPDAQRLTPFGKWLRATSLDELPELWNVVKGEMSLVGPRPLLMEYLPRYNPQQARRHEVRPGITGWAQINGRNAIGWDDKFRLDLWYVENHSVLLDLRILVRTLLLVLSGRGVRAPGSATMPEFMGDSPAVAEPIEQDRHK